MAALPLAVSIPDFATQMEMAVNSNTLLNAKVPALAKSAGSIAKTIITKDSGALEATSPEPEEEPQKRPRRRSNKRRRGREHSEKGQVTVEFPVVFALATAALLLCVHFLSYGFSHMLANHAAEEAAHAYGIGMSSEEVQRDVADHLPDAYGSGLVINRSPDDQVTVTLPVPSIVELHTSAKAGIVREVHS